jgi:hypothetical protein
MSILLVMVMVLALLSGVVVAEDPALPNWNIEGTWISTNTLSSGVTYRYMIVNEQDCNGNISGVLGLSDENGVIGEQTGIIEGWVRGNDVNIKYTRPQLTTGYESYRTGTIASDGTSMGGRLWDTSGNEGTWVATGVASRIEYYKAAPAVAAKLLQDAGTGHRYDTGEVDSRGRAIFSNYIAEVAHEMNKTPGTDFQGVPKSSVGEYECKIAAFLNSLRAGVTCTPQYETMETVTVYANNPAATLSDMVLESGVSYRLKATGVAEAGDTINFDASYSLTNRIVGDTWTNTVSGYTSYGEALLGLHVDGVFPDWGEYNENHTYYLNYLGTGGKVALWIYDIYYPNNSSSLTVEIQKVNW